MQTTSHPFLFAFTGIFLAVMLAAVGVMPARAGTLTVNTPFDTDDGVCDSQCSLREAIFVAGSGDTINFSPAMQGQTIRLDLAYGYLYIDKNLTIDGSSLDAPVTISGDADNSGGPTPLDSSPFFIQSGANVTLKGLTISGGYMEFEGGGGVYIDAGASLIVVDCTFSGNTATGGGAIYNNGSILRVTGSTFTGNHATSGSGGAIFNGGNLTVANSTFAGNTASLSGGGISDGGTLYLLNSTFSGNTATVGGGVYAAGTAMDYANTIIANSTGGDCAATAPITGNLNNLVEDGSCLATYSGDPLLGALADNSGPTQTMALLAGSPALNTGNAAVCTADPVNGVDQRGLPRDSQCDIGAFEGQESNDFVITVKTDNLSAGSSTDTQFTIPTTGGGYNYSVDCNDDGTFEATSQSGNYTCNYATAGTYTVRIRDNSGAGTGFPRIYFNSIGDRRKLLTIQQWGTGKWTSMAHAFDGCLNLTMTAADRPNLSGVTDMSSMFAGATVFNGDISEWTVASVQNMSAMFKDAVAFNQPVGEWDMSSVTDLSEMFFGAQAFNQPLAYWDTSDVTNMSAMFMRASSFNRDIGGWDTAGVTDMSFMFDDADAFNQDISGWNTANVTDMQYMFYAAAAFNQDIGGWNTAKVTNMHAMFTGSVFDQDLGGWDVGALTDAVDMFYEMTLSTANYDALLIGWGAQTLQADVYFNGGDSKYCAGADARAHMIADDGWTITDGGDGCASSSADLAIGMTRAGMDHIVFTLTVTNLGPDSADGATVQDTLGAGFANAEWTCTAEDGAVCAHPGGTGNVLDETIPTLPSGGRVVFVFQATIATAFIKDGNHASVSVPDGVVDPDLNNNEVTLGDRFRVLIPICSNTATWHRPAPPTAGGGTRR